MRIRCREKRVRSVQVYAHARHTHRFKPGSVRRSLHLMTFSTMPVRRHGWCRSDGDDDASDVGSGVNGVAIAERKDDIPFSFRVMKATRVGPSHAAQQCDTKLLWLTPASTSPSSTRCPRTLTCRSFLQQNKLSRITPNVHPIPINKNTPINNNRTCRETPTARRLALCPHLR